MRHLSRMAIQLLLVCLLGDQAGPWDRSAWKTEAFYGNTLTGFTGPS